MGLVAGSIIIWGLVGDPGEPVADVAIATPAASQPAPAISTKVSHDAAPRADSTKTTEQWIADTASGNATTRAAAIKALAAAPRAQALPVLGRLLTDGEPQIDRPLALQSLRDLALNQGDADGAIRDAIRHAIYHGDDMTKTDDAQEALEVIEESIQAQRDVSVSQR
jgi:hypothetical protein